VLTFRMITFTIWFGSRPLSGPKAGAPQQYAAVIKLNACQLRLGRRRDDDFFPRTWGRASQAALIGGDKGRGWAPPNSGHTCRPAEMFCSVLVCLAVAQDPGRGMRCGRRWSLAIALGAEEGRESGGGKAILLGAHQAVRVYGSAKVAER